MDRGQSEAQGKAGSAGSATDWGNLRFRRRRSGPPPGTAEDNAESRFWIGIVLFLAVAAVYPWYSYWVNAFLLTHELKVAGREISRQLESATKEIEREFAAAQAQQQQTARRQRVEKVRVLGAIPSRKGPIVIVELGRTSLSEATDAVCREAGGMLGMAVTGTSLRVQRYRGSQPAMDIGTIHCR